ncbi:hypothetical protein [Chitinophaga flava]|uniref:hypothetical protein n=1 Tax=Chitinophaga flava TaxID=2259036 RepID=UPI0011BE1C9A|nr:hypothetical protein [Chitinophaga flava]
MKFRLYRGHQGPRQFVALLKAFVAHLSVPGILFIPSSFSGDIAGWCLGSGKDAAYREHPAHHRRYSF